jgi:DNA helicase-2/ATP-dependent DNA helicase PcrA
VAVTRAKEHLYVSYAKWRNIYGSRHAGLPSRFLDEMPDALLARRVPDEEAAFEDDTITYE